MRSLLINLLILSPIIALAQKRVLLLVDDKSIEKSHSQFLSSLRDRGYVLTTRLANDKALALSKYGEFLYDHVILFAPKADGKWDVSVCTFCRPILLDFGGSVSANELARFVDGGGNVLVAADASHGAALADFAATVGFELSASGTALIDKEHFDAKLDDGQHTTVRVAASQLTSSELIVGDRAKLGPLLYRGGVFFVHRPKSAPNAHSP